MRHIRRRLPQLGSNRVQTYPGVALVSTSGRGASTDHASFATTLTILISLNASDRGGWSPPPTLPSHPVGFIPRGPYSKMLSWTP